VRVEARKEKCRKSGELGCDELWFHMNFMKAQSVIPFNQVSFESGPRMCCVVDLEARPASVHRLTVD